MQDFFANRKAEKGLEEYESDEEAEVEFYGHPGSLAVVELKQESRRDVQGLDAKIQQLLMPEIQPTQGKLSRQESFQQQMLYVPLQGSYYSGGQAPFDLDSKVKDYLSEANQVQAQGEESWKMLLLLGNAGSGKSSFTKKLEEELLSQWRGPQDLLPLRISLPSLENPQERAIEETLEAKGFSAEEIQTLKQNYRFLFILDGYDELNDYTNLYESNELKEWNAQSLLTCRPYHLNKFQNYYRYTYPLNDEGVPQMKAGRELYLAPFSQEQREVYIQSFLDQQGPEEGKWTVAQYEEKIQNLPGLKKLVETPLLLKMVVEVLPGLLAQKQAEQAQSENSGYLRININEIYEAFINQWFDREIEKYEDQQKITLTQAQKDQKRTHFHNFAVQLATAMNQAGVSEVSYKKASKREGKKQKDMWAKFFDSKDPEDQWSLHAAPLTRSDDGDKWMFLHKSLQEYFVTKGEVVVIKQEELQSTAADKPLLTGISTSLKKLIDNMNGRLEERNMIRFRRKL